MRQAQKSTRKRVEAFYAVYQSELPALTHVQLRTIYRRLAFYAHEVDDVASRKPLASDLRN